MSGTAAGDKPDYLGMSDDDFLNINAPASSDTSGKGQEETPGSAVVTAPVEINTKDEGDTSDTTGNDQAAASTDTVADPDVDAGGDDADPASGAAPAAAPAGKDGVKVDAPVAGKSVTDPKVAAADPAAATKDAAKVEEKPVDTAAFYNQVMAPFKANGRTIELKTPEEAIRLMQMGAGFGRKLQSLQPALKTLKMLEKANLLDEGKLSFLIDINNKNPEAIKKLIKDSGIDPLDLDMGDNVSYSPKNHAVTDKEMAFHSAMEDVQSHQGGQETLRVVNQTWDQESKSALWDQPELLGVIQSQRENGVYDQIAVEIDRQKLLGKIPQNAPFLQAYKLAGDHLQATNGFKVTASKTPIRTQSGDTPQPQVIETRAAAPKAQVQNSDKAAAAASTKSTPRGKASSTVNPLEMADDEFLKQFQGRI